MNRKITGTHKVTPAFQGVKWGLVLSVILFSSGFVMAQLTTGTISGTVKDLTGAIIPGADISLAHLATGTARTAVSDDSGRYQAQDLRLGEYEVRVELPGFRSVVRTGIMLTAGRHAVVDVVLEIGELTEIVTVAGDAPLVETTTSTIAYSITQEQLVDLPIAQRDLTQAIFLQAGVIQQPERGDSEPRPQGGMGNRLVVAGRRGYENAFLMDGVSIGDLSGNPQGASSNFSGAESIAEFRVITNNYGAQYTSVAGAIISAVTKSGSNELHGSLFWTHRNDSLNAARFFDKAFDVETPTNRQNQAGFSLGGPIAEDRTFFFGSYEGLRETSGRTQTARVPSLALRQGILPDGRTIPINPAVLPYVDLWDRPTPENTVEVFQDDTVRIVGVRNEPIHNNFFIVKVDHELSSASSISGTYSFDRGDRSPFGLLDEVRGNRALKSRRDAIAAQYKHIISPTTLNQIKFGFTFTKPEGDVVLSERDFSDLAFVPGRDHFGTFSPGSVSSIGWQSPAGHEEQRSISLAEDFSMIRGRHDLRLGVQFMHFSYRLLGSVNQYHGAFTILDDTWENFLLGRAERLRVVLLEADVGTASGIQLNQLKFSSYIQDDYRIRPTLTLNLGLRYEFITVPKEEKGRTDALRNLFVDQEMTPGPLYTNATLLSFGPRFGFAWAPRTTTSLRAGFGIFYDHPGPLHNRSIYRRHPKWNPVASVRDRDAVRTGRTLNFPTAFTDLPDLFGEALEVRAFQYDQDNGYVYRWSMALQQQVGQDWGLSATYTGSRGLHAWVNFNADNVNQWEGFPDQPEGRKFFPEGAEVFRDGNPLVVTEYNSANGDSYYHGLGLEIQKRFSRGLTFQWSYNWSKTISMTSDLENNSFQLPQGQRTDYLFDLDKQRSLASHHVGRVFAGSFSYELPRTNAPGFMRHVFDGWQLSGIVRLSDGPPLTIEGGAHSRAPRPHRCDAAAGPDSRREQQSRPQEPPGQG